MYPIYFKEVWTTNTCEININPSLTIERFIESVSGQLSTEFNIDENELDIIEAGQCIFDIASEDAPALIPSNITLQHKWGETLKDVSFYVRRKNYQYPASQTYRELRATEHECPICLENGSVMFRFNNCCHSVCSFCRINCQRVNYFICPLCRAR
jgi:hypothetical protein